MDIISRKEILQHVDHTLLAPTATWEELQILCDEAIKYETASVCVPPNRVKQVKDYLCGRMAVCTVVGFPNGYHTTAVKAMETEEVLDRGADEVDMVINLGWVKEKRFHDVQTEIHTLKDICDDKILKVIVETCFLTEEEKIKMCEVVTEAGADFIKTSTGKQQPAATPEAAYVMCEAIKEYYQKTGNKIGFKPAGGINTVNDAIIYYTIVKEILGEEWLNNRLFRLGTSRLANLLLSDIKGEEIKFF